MTRTRQGTILLSILALFFVGFLGLRNETPDVIDLSVGATVPCKDDETKKVHARIKDCPIPASDRATFKGQEIAKLGPQARTARQTVDIEIVDINPIDKGVEVFARAWNKDGTQIGFGRDGSVDIERFIIINPPVMVRDDVNGDYVREIRDIRTGGITGVHKFREDTKEAVLQVLEHNLSVMKNIHDSAKIRQEKRGNTTTTVYPAAGANTPVDGYVHNSGAVYSTVRDAATGADANVDGVNYAVQHYKTGSTYHIVRASILFDTSSIPDTDTKDSATYNFYVVNFGSPDAQSNSLVQSSIAATNNITTADYDAFGTTKGATDILDSDMTIGAYNVFTLNATGLGWIDVTGITYLGHRAAEDIAGTAPAGVNFIDISAADTAGTTQDPKLVVEHTGVAVPAPTQSPNVIWFE